MGSTSRGPNTAIFSLLNDNVFLCNCHILIPKCNDYTENVIFAKRLEIRGKDGNCMHWTVHLTLQGMHLYIFETTLDAQIQTMLYTDQKMCYIHRLFSS